MFIVDNRNVLKNFYLKDDYNGKLRLEVIIDNFLDAAATVDLPMPQKVNDVNLSKLEPWIMPVFLLSMLELYIFQDLNRSLDF